MRCADSSYTSVCSFFCFFFFNDTATTEIYTLSYTTLFRSKVAPGGDVTPWSTARFGECVLRRGPRELVRSEEHTSELQSRRDLVCRLLLEKKKKITRTKVHDRKHTELDQNTMFPTHMSWTG